MPRKLKPDAPPTCSYCGNAARLVSGIRVYPKRPDLHELPFWHCAPCKAWVGCHKGTELPLGRLADETLRKAKSAAHRVFDPIWRNRLDARRAAGELEYTRQMARGGRYKKLAELMGLTSKECHIGELNAEQCARVVEICKSGALS